MSGLIGPRRFVTVDGNETAAHVAHKLSDRNVNVLVLDTEVYSNTAEARELLGLAHQDVRHRWARYAQLNRKDGSHDA